MSKIWVFAFVSLLSLSVFADAWEDVLKQAGLTKEQIRFDKLDVQMVSSAQFQTPFFTLLHGDPLRIPFFTKLYRGSILKAADKPFDVLLSSLARAGLAVRRTLEGNPLAEIEKRADAKDGLVETIAFCIKRRASL